MTLQGVKRKVVTVSDFRFTGRLLGKGNFARVEEAVHNILNVKVAVKIIDIKEIKEKYVVKNLHREARILAMLNHPCIAALFQAMQLGDSMYYLVTELVDGGDLCSFIIGQRYGKLEERPARIYARQFTSALSHMHSFGIVHRDLKMENVMLNSTQTQIKIVDFGLSNVWTCDNPLRTHCGSPEYAAPELFIAGKEYGPEVDLWSLGIIFYGMVVGQLPFVSGRKTQLSSQERRKRLVAQINKGLGTSQRQAIAPLSPEFRAMLNRLLIADPMKRITVKELIVHPWITEKGRKFIQTHPIRKLDGQWQTKFTKQIGNLFEIDQNTAIEEICKNPYGRIGGMYNIMSYKTLVEPFNADTIAPLIPRTEQIEQSPKKFKPKSAPAVKGNTGIYGQCAALLNRVSKAQIDERPRTVNTAAVVTNNSARLTRSKIDHLQCKPVQSTTAKASYSKISSIIINKRSQEIPSGLLPVKNYRSAVSSRDNNRQAGSEIAKNSKRPLTTGAMLATARPIKRSSVPTAASSRTTSRYTPTNQMAMGDFSSLKKKPSSSILHKGKLRDPLANDPIARSIAGYLVKNVPDKMLNIQFARK